MSEKKPLDSEFRLLEEGETTHRFSFDNYENRDTTRAAYLAAGGTVEAIKAVCDEGANNHVDSAFAIVRPPGHHGFCN